jgi:hypothetical protein
LPLTAYRVKASSSNPHYRHQVKVCESVDDGSSEDSLASCSSKPIVIAQAYTAAGREMLSAIDASPFLGAVLPRTPQRRTRLFISGRWSWSLFESLPG